MRICQSCGKEVPKERIDAIPDTVYCVKCVDQHGPRYKAFMSYSHKTAPELIIISSRDVEGIRRAERANKRSR